MKRYGECGNSCFHVSVRVPSPLTFCEASRPFDRVTYLAGTVMLISSVVFCSDLSIVGNQHDELSVSPCVHIWVGLSFSVPSGLIKYKPLASLIAALPFAFNK